MGAIIAVKHNIEVAHRLLLLPGKCENIHGHSMKVTLYLQGELNDNGILEGIEFGDLKQTFRSHLDSVYDHRLLLNMRDPWAGRADNVTDVAVYLPGLITTNGDPTTENIAKWIGMYMQQQYPQVAAVDVWETDVNMGQWSA